MPQSTEHTFTILLVEDEPSIRDYRIALLSSLGYNIIAAADGVRALTKLEESNDNIDIVLSDIMMPHMDGYEFCAKMKQNPRFTDIPFIFVSMLSSLDEKLKGYEVGGDDYLTKSAPPEELAKKVQALLAIRKRNRELKVDANESHQAAIAALVYSSDLGKLLGFVNDVLQVKSFESLSERLFTMTRDLGLRTSILYKTPQGALSFGDSGEVSPLEVDIIGSASTQNRFTDFGCRTIVNHDTFSLLIKNMPIDKPEKCRQIKETLSSPCNAIEAKVQNLLAGDTRTQRKAVLDNAQKTLDEIRNSFQKLQAASNAALLNTIDEIDASIKQLGLTQSQEQNIHTITQANMKKLKNILDESKALSGKFVDVKTTLGQILKTGGS